MTPARIAELLAPFLGDGALAPPQLDQISMYIDLLLRWNERINLTAIREPDEIVSRHFGESLFAARHLLATHQAASSPARLVDFGSGAGFPGLPFKLWSPQIPATLIESNHKKVAFLREVIRALTLTDIDVFSGRAETYPAATAPLVTLRAVERFTDVLPTAAQLLTPGGRLVLLISTPQVPLAKSAPILWSPPLPIPHSSSRVLLVGVRPGDPEQQ